MPAQQDLQPRDKPFGVFGGTSTCFDLYFRATDNLLFLTGSAQLVQTVLSVQADGARGVIDGCEWVFRSAVLRVSACVYLPVFVCFGMHVCHVASSGRDQQSHNTDQSF